MSADVLPITSSRRAWLELRRGGLGGSDAPAVVGLDPFKTPMGLWLDKTAQLPLDEAESDPARWGRLLEDAVIVGFEEDTGLHVGARQQWAVHPERPWQRATLDGLVYASADEDAEVLGLYEGKTASSGSFRWEDGVPEHVQIQVQHNLAVTGLSRAWVAALILHPVPHLDIHEIERDEEVIALLVEMEEAFWKRVEDRVPPPTDGSPVTGEALKRAYRVAEPFSVELPAAVADLVAERHAAHELKKAAEERLQAAENALMAALGDAEAGTHNGQIVVTWKSVGRTSLDTKALAAAHPEIAAEFTRKTTYRRFGFPSRKGEE